MINSEALTDAIYQNGFYVMDDFLGDQHYYALQKTIQNLQSRGNFRPARIGHQQKIVQNTSIRTDTICWLDQTDPNPAIQAYFAAINQISSILNRNLYLGLMDYETHFAVYQPGTFYKKHVDQFHTTQDRRISCVYYLNQEWQTQHGGELMLYNQQHELLHTIHPLGNRLVCFSSDLPHEVCTTQQIRYSLVGWMKTRPIIR